VQPVYPACTEYLLHCTDVRSAETKRRDRSNHLPRVFERHRGHFGSRAFRDRKSSICLRAFVIRIGDEIPVMLPSHRRASPRRAQGNCLPRCVDGTVVRGRLCCRPHGLSRLRPNGRQFFVAFGRAIRDFGLAELIRKIAGQSDPARPCPNASHQTGRSRPSIWVADDCSWSRLPLCRPRRGHGFFPVS
jgi:hypothetical protein